MTEYEFTKETQKLGIPKYRINVETEDITFLNFLDKKIDDLIKEFYGV